MVLAGAPIALIPCVNRVYPAWIPILRKRYCSCELKISVLLCELVLAMVLLMARLKVPETDSRRIGVTETPPP